VEITATSVGLPLDFHWNSAGHIVMVRNALRQGKEFTGAGFGEGWSAMSISTFFSQPLKDDKKG
jgi:hypothetical protein